ncbi:hypothetical protein LC605_19535 [Nostoc sp. CHAB 5836]|nr:hypothetical protein [Nostoc sp. CHAB 5836]
MLRNVNSLKIFTSDQYFDFAVPEFTVSISTPLDGTAVELRSRWRSLS